ncbi:hypothetical protein [Lacrimispora sp. JR3]|uniref:hypothetical protein n=1 Tax=Lacrimispora sinapis TaxID=3111456 RepID=UPI00374A03F7
MANETNNYKLPKPEADDFYDISEYNKTMDLLDESLNDLDKKKLDKNGDASAAVTQFEQEVLREDIESGETLSVTHGKIKKWFSEMKDVAFSGKAKDIVPDAAHRFVTDTEKNDWNGKVSASGGDVSETVIGTLETIDTKYPVPSAGETTKVFMGKVGKFMEDIRPLNTHITVYVSTTGSDLTGDGTETNPYQTIQHAIDILPKDLGGHVATINIAAGTYTESPQIIGYYNGELRIYGPAVKSTGSISCKIVGNFLATRCFYIEIKYVEVINTKVTSFNILQCTELNIQYIKSITASQDPGITVVGVKRFYIDQTEVSNRNVGILFDNSVGWIAAISGSNNGIGIASEWASSVTILGNISIGYNENQFVSNLGGQFIQSNGSQIAYLTSSGLSCTWGTLLGGYSRHGNLNVAMVSITLNVTVTSDLTAGQIYRISGFPSLSFSNSGIAVASSLPREMGYCVMINNVIELSPSNNIVAGRGFGLSVTYFTNQ